MSLELSEKGQTLFEMLIEIPPKMEAAEWFLQKENLSVEEITKVGISYADECFLDARDSDEDVDIITEVIPDRHSTYIYEVIRLLLPYGLEPNAVYDDENIMLELQYIDNELVGADTLALLLENGGDPNLVFHGETLYQRISFDVFFDVVEMPFRYRYNALLHFWMVLVGYGGKYRDDEIKVFHEIIPEWGSGEKFDIKKLKNHRNFYFGVSFGRVIHIYDKATQWEVARFE